MASLTPLADGSHRRIWINRVVALVAVAAVIVTAVLWFSRETNKRHYLTLAAGDPAGHRYQIAQALCEEAERQGLQIELLASQGSREDLERLVAGKLDVALVGGEVGHDQEEVRQVATLISEPLHLFARGDIDKPTDLRGKRVGMGGELTGTRHVATRLMRFVGLKPGRDFTDLGLSPSQLERLTADQLPDAFFVISSLPWQAGEKFVREHGYRLIELPFGDALSLTDREMHDFVIPAFSYGAEPAVPPAPLHTVATPMLLIAKKDLSSGAVERLMEVLFEHSFARRASLPPLDASAVLRLHDFHIHPGTLAYLRRGAPIVNEQMLSNLENLRGVLVSAALSVFLLWRWYRSRQLIRFEVYFDSVAAIELEATRKRQAGQLDAAQIDRLLERLAIIKADVLEKHADGSLNGEEQLMSFLIHASDVRAALNRLADEIRDGTPLSL
jgi:TRAP transporter TAXI family solute receptor